MLAETWRPDVVLMDLQMPQLNGFEATRLIKRSSWGAQIPIIILSADCEVSNSADALAAGALSFMAKPFIDAEILAALGSALNLTYA